MTAPVAGVEHRDAGTAETAHANRHWWDGAAPGYQAEHGEFLGDDDLLWCPEGLRESQAMLLGDPAGLVGLDVLELGCGAAQGGRWLAARGARVTALDLSAGQLTQAQQLNARSSTPVHRLVQGDAQRLPIRDERFDLVASAFGALPFVADSAGTFAEVARVLRPDGRAVLSSSHPVRWVFADDPGPAGLVVRQSYFDRTPYVEIDSRGAAVYVEHHRTVGDRVRDVVAAGLVLLDVVEPLWPHGHERQWGQWSPMRGALLPGTAIWVVHKPAA